MFLLGTFFSITKSAKHKNNGFDTEYEIGELFENEGGFVVSDDILDNNQKAIEPLFTKRRQNHLDVDRLFQSYIDSPKRTIRKNDNKTVWFQQT